MKVNVVNLDDISNGPQHGGVVYMNLADIPSAFQHGAYVSLSNVPFGFIILIGHPSSTPMTPRSTKVKHKGKSTLRWTYLDVTKAKKIGLNTYY